MLKIIQLYKRENNSDRTVAVVAADYTTPDALFMWLSIFETAHSPDILNGEADGVARTEYSTFSIFTTFLRACFCRLNWMITVETLAASHFMQK